MKILFTTSDANNFISGVHSWMQKLVLELRLNNHHCHFLVFEIGKGPYSFINFLNKYSFHYITVKADDYLYTPERTKFIIEHVKNIKPDVFMPGFLIAALYAIPWIKKENILTVNFIHSDDKICSAIADRFVKNTDVKWNSDIVFSVSKYIYNIIGGKNISNHYYAPYGIQPSINISVYQNPLKVIYFGRIEEEQKCISDTVRGMINVLKILPNCEFDIYGMGSAVEQIKMLIKNEGQGLPIQYKGSVESSSTYEILSKYQVFLLLSDYEGLPVALLEAMSCGLVPICMNIKSGVDEVIEHNENGFLVENREKDVLENLLCLINNKAIWELMSQKCIELVNTNFSIGRQAKLFINKIEDFSLNDNDIFKNIGSKVILPRPHINLHYGIEDVRMPSLFRKIQNTIHIFSLMTFKKIENIAKKLLKNQILIKNKKKWKNVKLANNSVVQIFNDNSLFIGEGTIIEENTSIKSIGFSSLININRFCHFRSYTSIRAWEAGRVIISESVFLNNFCSINCYNRIDIGKNTLLGEGVKIYDHNHIYSFEPDLFVKRNEFCTSPVIIGNNCWIGSNVTILMGVTIGDNVIIGANCLIYKSIPSNSIVKHKEDLIIETRDSNV